MKTLNSNDFGTYFLVEDCQQIKVSDFLSKYKLKLKELVLNTELEMLNAKIHLATSQTPYNGIRFWFQCPLCKGRVGIIYRHPVINRTGCRICLSLDYRKRRYKGMIEEKSL